MIKHFLPKNLKGALPPSEMSGGPAAPSLYPPLFKEYILPYKKLY